MNFKTLNEDQKKEMADLMFTPLESAEGVKDWAKAFLDLELPLEITDPDSNTSPLDAIWKIYNTFKTNSGNVTPGFILMSCREGMKTVSVSILELLLMLHFSLDVAHGAATEAQSSVAIKYINGFIMKISPLIEKRGWVSLTENKRTIQYQTPDNKTPYIKILICSPKGMNSLHSNVIFLDELDLADKQAIKEAKNITGYSKGIYGVTVYLSTRKYSFGNMQDALDRSKEMNYSVLNWNILDVTEACPPERHRPDLPKQDVFVKSKSLPLVQISPEEWNGLSEVEKTKYTLLPNVPAGCIGCKILPVCQTRLSEKPQTATGGFYKPITSVIQKFRENDADIAEAQLMCFSENTQILMADGTSKSISLISIGDEVISHTGKKCKVSKIFNRPYSGSVYKIKNINWKNFEETFVTPEHPYFVNGKEFKSFSNLTPFKFDKWGSLIQKGDRVSLPSNCDLTFIEHISVEDYIKGPFTNKENEIRLKLSKTGRFIPKNFTLNNNFGWIIGYFLAEGYFLKSKDRPIGITFCSHKKESEYHNRVRNFASSLGLTVSEFKNKNNDGYTIDIYNSALANLFTSLCGEYSDKKRLHEKLFNSNLDFLSGIIEGFNDGDGTKRKAPHKELTTVSYPLASQLFTIAARLGLCPRLTKKPAVQNRKRTYLVHFIDPNYTNKQKRTRFKYLNSYNTYRMECAEKTNFEGVVYNLEVDKDHSYIANGVAVHNCWKPGSEGLVYPRFSRETKNGNVTTLAQAYEILTGEKAPLHVSEPMIHGIIRSLDLPTYAGVDWGFTHDAVIVIVAKIPNGELWIIDCFSSPGLEIQDLLPEAIALRDKYRPIKWYCDQNMPAYIKAFNRNGMSAPKFTKDVPGGIGAVRSKIMTAAGQRFLKVLETKNTKKVIDALSKHRFLLDGQGNVTATPDDDAGTADICDTIRYIGQNMFPVSGPQRPNITAMNPSEANIPEDQRHTPQQHEMMQKELAKVIGGSALKGSSGKRGGFSWNM